VASVEFVLSSTKQLPDVLELIEVADTVGLALFELRKSAAKTQKRTVHPCALCFRGRFGVTVPGSLSSFSFPANGPLYILHET